MAQETQETLNGTKIRLRVDVVVTDVDKLLKYAVARYKECWKTDMPTNEDRKYPIEQLAFEALVGSNENPSPAEYGIEIADYVAFAVSDDH